MQYIHTISKKSPEQIQKEKISVIKSRLLSLKTTNSEDTEEVLRLENLLQEAVDGQV